ncbi:hypothetical protein [Haloactinospora alba]|uniref:hypothetical protein n=1 Tax=Haloactinospora alba TaxID=405555 RepID=UPI00114EA58E|nr:hypothetical protein [Haloactinospora alba]
MPEREHRRWRSAPVSRPRQACLAADGTAMHGSRRSDGTRAGVFHLARHSDAVVTTVQATGAKHTETAAFTGAPDRLADEDLAGCLITADALHTVRAHASYLHRRAAHYLFYVTTNRAALHARLAGLPWKQVG